MKGDDLCTLVESQMTEYIETTTFNTCTCIITNLEAAQNIFTAAERCQTSDLLHPPSAGPKRPLDAREAWGPRERPRSRALDGVASHGKARSELQCPPRFRPSKFAVPSHRPGTEP